MLERTYRRLKVVLSCAFGAVGQVVVGACAFLVGIGAWLYWSFIAPPTVSVVFHISMFFGLAACYAIIATGLSVIWLNRRTPDA